MTFFCHDCSVVATIKVNHFHLFLKKFLKFHNWLFVCLFVWTSTYKYAAGPNTEKSMPEALIFASTNPQYYDRLLIELEVQYVNENTKLKPG